MDSRLFEIDPYAGVSYGLYKSYKGSDASFEDFLVHYDSSAANKGDSSWLTDMMSQSISDQLNTPEVWQAMSALGVHMNTSNSFLFFDAQVSALKLQLFEAFNQRKPHKETASLLQSVML